MNRFTALMLVFSLSLLLCACRMDKPLDSAPTKPEPTYVEHECTTPPETQPPETQTPSQIIPAQQPMVSVAVPVTHDALYADDGTLLFDYAYQTMYLTVPDPSVADAIIPDFLNRVDATWETADSLSAAAQADYTGSNDWIPYLCSVLYNPARIDQNVLSLFGSFSSFRGASHPEHVPIAVTYDLTSGRALALSDVLMDGITAETVSELIVQALVPEEKELYLYSGYAETVRTQLQRAFHDCENWYLSEDGLCFFYPQYEIAPYSTGIVSAVVSYENLTGILRDNYFPVEADMFTGSLQPIAFSDADLEQFTQYTELILEEGTQKLLLCTDSMVTDIRIMTCSLSEDGESLTSEATVFAAAALTPGDAIMLEAAISETAPTLRIQWRSGGELYASFLLQSGKDGSFYLADN